LSLRVTGPFATQLHITGNFTLLSPQERVAWRKRFAKFSRSHLIEIGAELLRACRTNTTDRETEVREGHHRPELVARVIRPKGKYRRLQTIYCSPEGCGSCPHGPYWYVHQKRGGVTEVRFAGQPALDEGTLERMKRHALKATASVEAYEVKNLPHETEALQTPRVRSPKPRTNSPE
jgi:hypothetical protein